MSCGVGVLFVAKQPRSAIVVRDLRAGVGVYGLAFARIVHGAGVAAVYLCACICFGVLWGRDFLGPRMVPVWPDVKMSRSQSPKCPLAAKDITARSANHESCINCSNSDGHCPSSDLGQTAPWFTAWGGILSPS